MEAGSIADGNFHYGDIIMHVNGKSQLQLWITLQFVNGNEVQDVKGARVVNLEIANI